MIAAAFPGRLTGEKESLLNTWAMFLDGMDSSAVVEAAKDLCSSNREFPPSVGQVRHRAAELSLGILAPPSGVEAWERAVRRSRGDVVDLQEDEIRALEFIGGTWAVKHSERPEIIRSQFLKAYAEFCQTRIIENRSHESTKALANMNAPALPPHHDDEDGGNEEHGPPATPEEIRELLGGADAKSIGMLEGVIRNFGGRDE
jgi:hypothetical protein